MDAATPRIAMQFSLRALLLGIALLSALLAFVPLVAAAAMMVLGAACYFASTGSSRLERLGEVLLLMPMLIVTECGCALLAYHTMGEIYMGMYFLAVTLNIFALMGFTVSLRAGVGIAAMLAILIIPYQLHLWVRWSMLHRESTLLIEFLEERRAKYGKYPSDLASYRSSNSAATQEIAFWPDQPNGYVLSYHIGSHTTCHEYSPVNGWSYYPD